MKYISASISVEKDYFDPQLIPVFNLNVMQSTGVCERLEIICQYDCHLPEDAMREKLFPPFFFFTRILWSAMDNGTKKRAVSAVPFPYHCKYNNTCT